MPVTAVLLDAARRFALAARGSVQAVREEIARTARIVEPAVDGVLIYEQHADALTCVAAFGERFAYFAGTGVCIDDRRSPAARARAAGHRVTLLDNGVRALHPGDAAVLAVPLEGDGDRAGVLVVASRHVLSPGAVDALVTLAEHAAPAYLIALDRDLDRRRAEYDGLTGLLTPRAFRQRLAALVERSRTAPAAPHALVFADTDHFKRWNDEYGHAAGDALLRELAQVLRGATSTGDLVARNGGDEFCVVFAECGKAAAVDRAEDLRRRIAAIDLAALRPSSSNAGLRISASIGVAAFPADASSASMLLERADAAMYHTKQTGRDGVSYAGLDGRFERLQQPSSDRPGSSLVSAFPSVL
jgi:diguanylate cyclase (GGDEF)-like protein